MTVKETLERILADLPEEDQQQLLDFVAFLRWRKEQASEPGSQNGFNEQEDLQAAQKAASFPLPNANLKILASKHQPPQSRYDGRTSPSELCQGVLSCPVPSAVASSRQVGVMRRMRGFLVMRLDPAGGSLCHAKLAARAFLGLQLRVLCFRGGRWTVGGV
jgi:hypothetical protein